MVDSVTQETVIKQRVILRLTLGKVVRRIEKTTGLGARKSGCFCPVLLFVM